MNHGVKIFVKRMILGTLYLVGVILLSDEMVKTLMVGETVIDGDVLLTPGNNIDITSVGNEIVIDAIPYTVNTTNQIVDSNINETKPIQMFVGTQTEWDNFEKNNNIKYLVFIHS